MTPEEEISRYTVWTVWKLGTGEVAVSGSISGSLLKAGRRGSAQTSYGVVEVLVVGIGVSDRTIGPPDRQGILVKMLKGDPEHLNGAVLEFPEVGKPN